LIGGIPGRAVFGCGGLETIKIVKIMGVYSEYLSIGAEYET
jgi:hypothetical protein